MDEWSPGHVTSYEAYWIPTLQMGFTKIELNFLLGGKLFRELIVYSFIMYIGHAYINCTTDEDIIQ